LIIQRSTCKERGPGAAAPDRGRREARAHDEEEKVSTQGKVEAVRVETAPPSVGVGLVRLRPGKHLSFCKPAPKNRRKFQTQHFLHDPSFKLLVWECLALGHLVLIGLVWFVVEFLEHTP